MTGAFSGNGNSFNKNFHNIQALIKQYYIGKLAGFQTAQAVRLADDPRRIDSSSLNRVRQGNAKSYGISQAVHQIGDLARQSAVREGCPVSADLHSLAAKGILAVSQSCSPHTVADENNAPG